MSTFQKNITLGTAGHIDHGKTVLIKCLTGCDTDHLKAEKERGMSIELGFAPCTISDLEVGIVDVPGHENFIKTMVAGATGIDGVIFVIAADDGVMPQTREHLDILTLLGVEYGIAALTKADCVDDQRIENVIAEIKDFLIGTFLEDAPILPVSGITGQGLDTFYEALKELVDKIGPKKTHRVFRMPVERAFSVKGYGTVATGIPVAGKAKIGQQVTLFPQGVQGRIKAIQVYKRNSETALVGQCAALNVPRWDYGSVERGNVVTIGEYFEPERWYLCSLKVLGDIKTIIKSGAKMKFHTGTSEIVATVYLLKEKSVCGGQECVVQTRLHEPVVAGPGDRFILRTLSPVKTVGGGVIVEALGGKLKRNNPHVVEDAGERARAVLVDKDFVEYCIKTADGCAVSVTDLSVRTKILGGPLKRILAELVEQGRILELSPEVYMHCDRRAAVQRQLLEIAGEFHCENPESPGLSREQFYEASELRKDVFESVVELLVSEGKLAEKKHRIALADHKETFSEEEEELLEEVESLYRGQAFKPPKLEEVCEKVQADPAKLRKIIQILIEQEHLVRVERDLLFHGEAVEQAREHLISYIKKEGRLESVKFKYLLDTSRKYAIPLLDYFDRIGLTRRAGYTRYLKDPTID
jgi:selenocysteine-specific elongation factor